MRDRHQPAPTGERLDRLSDPGVVPVVPERAPAWLDLVDPELEVARHTLEAVVAVDEDDVGGAIPARRRRGPGDRGQAVRPRTRIRGEQFAARPAAHAFPLALHVLE